MRNLEQNTFALKIVTFDDGEESAIEVLPYMFLPLDCDLSNFEVFRRSLYFDPNLSGVSRVERFKEDIDFEMFEHAARELASKLKFDDRLSFGHSDDVKDPYFMPALLAHALHGGCRDGVGLPYIEHPRSVVLKAEVALVENTWTDRDFIPGLCAAWLQNIFSSVATSFYRKISAVDLSDWGISDETLEILDLLARNEETLNDVYFAGILSHSTARAINLAELAQLIWTRRSVNGDVSRYDEELAALRYHPDVDTWFHSLVNSELLSIWPQYGLQISEALSKAQTGIPVRFRFARSDMNALESLMFVSVSPDRLLERLHTVSDDELAISLFSAYFARFNDITFEVDELETEWRFRSAVGKSVDPRFLPSDSVSIEEIQARAARVFANQQRFTNALAGSNHVEENGFIWPSSGPYSLLDEFTNDELAEMAALGMSFEFGPHPYSHEYKTILGAALKRLKFSE